LASIIIYTGTRVTVPATTVDVMLFEAALTVPSTK